MEVLVQDVGTQDGISPKACSQYVLEEDGDPTCAFRAAVPSGQPWDQARYNIPNPPNDEERRQLGIALQVRSKAMRQGTSGSGRQVVSIPICVFVCAAALLSAQVPRA